ncbi:hypothetical protein Cgig2_010177 [Carnegiea gigantea]|uniref:DRBM domain-containing protein n=1 Tax=Carnegiea gigantea TaxID=171969 RepID=A0A9Q1KID4_9CARY|nr:hypothetical protein Cgig2_010177 [Carnegiea gigantea]
MSRPREPPMYKNKLQEYTQKLGLPFPAYRTANEGFQHAPKFRSTVFVDGAEYTSRQTFRRLKEAEQDAAKLAYECIMSNAEQFGTKPLLDQDPKSNKLVLHGLAFKKQWDIPKYSTTLSESQGSLPVYVSTVIAGGKSFSGDGGRNKREAEQFAARTALQSLLRTESSSALANQTMSKKRCYDPQVKVGFTDFKQKKLISNPAPRPPKPGMAQQPGFRRKLGS